MKLGRKKPIIEGSLEESEIQDKLYGEYHTGVRRRAALVKEVTVTTPKPKPPSVAVVQPPVLTVERPWTGEEILKGELERLRTELIRLHREKDRLAEEIPQKFNAELTWLRQEKERVATETPPKIQTELTWLRQEHERLVKSVSKPVKREPVHHRTIRERLARRNVLRKIGRAHATTTEQVTLERPAPKRLRAPRRIEGLGRLSGVVAGVLVASACLGVGFHTMVLEAEQPPVFFSGEPSVYTVQVGVYDIKRLADRFVDSLSAEGYPAFMVEAPRRNGKPRYRIYIGRYASQREASELVGQLKRHPDFKDSFLRLR